MRNTIEFVFNGELRKLENVDPTLTVLRYLRELEHATGTKEGCAEGDCGACTAVVASLENGGLRYRAVNTCIQFVASLDGKALLSVEYLKGEKRLDRVQELMVEEHGTQCGFCTPGFVMSMYAGARCKASPARSSIDKLLAGNLCRCTGYTPIIRATDRLLATEASPEDVAFDELKEIKLLGSLKQLPEAGALQYACEDKKYFAPTTVEELADVLIKHPSSTLLAGGTDVGLWVTKAHRKLDSVVYVGKVTELREIHEKPQSLRLGAAVTYEAAQGFIKNRYPSFAKLIDRIAATQVRNVGTIGGNIGNGSPIGDTPPALIAIGAKLTLRRGQVARSIPLEDFFIQYGKKDLQPSEFIESIEIPDPTHGSNLQIYKITKRFEQDISAVCGAFNLTFETDGGVCKVSAARICFGGMAGTPKRATHCENALVGKVWDERTLHLAQAALLQDYQPLSDWRGSAEYRIKVAQNLLRKYFLETTHGEAISIVDHVE